MKKSAAPSVEKRPCYLCGGFDHKIVPGKVRDLPQLGIRQCAECGLVFLENFNHMKKDYYEHIYPKGRNEPTDWNQYINESRCDDNRRAQQILPLVINKSFIDVGCGAGGLLLALKDHCQDVSGLEVQSRWRKAIQAQGIHVYSSLKEIQDGQVDVMGLFHVLEHLPDPIATLREMVTKLKSKGKIVIEVPSANDALLQLYRSKSFSEFTYWSPHLYLFTPRTLSDVLNKAGLTDYHIQQYQRYPLSNHLMWLANGKPGGHQTWAFLDTPQMTQAYSDRLASLGYCDTLLAFVTLP